MSGGDRARPDWLVIARREFLERVRSKWFVVVTLLAPVLMVALAVVPAVLARHAGTAHIAIVDPTGKVGKPIEGGLTVMGWEAEVVDSATPEAELLDRVKRGRIDGFLTIPGDIFDGTGVSTEVVYRGENASNQAAVIDLGRVVRQVVQAARADMVGLSEGAARQFLMPVEIDARHTTGEGKGASGMATFFLGYGLMFVLYLSIIVYAVMVMRSVVQEKTNRVVEIMVAAAKPRALMLGKVLGVGSLGLLQLSIWLTIAVVTLKYRMAILGMFGVTVAFSLPPLSIDQVAVSLGYFLLGYFFYAALYAAIGAMVSSEQEAQQAQTPLMLLIMLSALCVTVVTNDPRGTAAEVLTLIPFSAPMLMPMRYLLGGASMLQLALSMVVLAASILGVSLLAARIYRVGILMYGKRPSLREIARWMRY